MASKRYGIICGDCGKECGATKKRYEKWQIRLGEAITKCYKCADCRKKQAKQMMVTIPDSTLKVLQGNKDIKEAVQPTVGAIFGIQVTKMFQW